MPMIFCTMAIIFAIGGASNWLIWGLMIVATISFVMIRDDDNKRSERRHNELLRHVSQGKQ